MSIVFYEKSHRYRVDGRWCPGVTTLIKGGLPAPALMYWSARMVAEWVADHPDDVERLRQMGRGAMVAALKEIPWDKRDTAAVKGTEVHALAEQIVAGQRVKVPDHLAGYVDACVDFLDTWKPRPLVIEKSVCNRSHWWAGRLDLIATLPDGRTALFDWKTGASGIWPETAFQLSAYAHAEVYADDGGTEHPLPKVDFAAAVWLRPDGYDVIPVRADDQSYTEFRHIAFVSKAAKRAKDDHYVGQPLPVPGSEEAA